MELSNSIDATIFTERGLSGAGLVIRRENGIFIAAKTMKAQGIMEPKETEAWVLLQAIKWLPNIPFHNS